MINKLISKFLRGNKKGKRQVELSIERIAEHEAAHGIVWYLFRDNWIVNQLTIEPSNLPDESMKGALNITPNFNGDLEAKIERANELVAIAYAGMIGQNMNLIKQRLNLLIEITQVEDLNQIFDMTECGGDFEIVNKFLPHLGSEFRVRKESFTKYKIMDLVLLFQNHNKVQSLHNKLSLLLLERITLSRNELMNFFDEHRFSEYVSDEGLDINFFHRR